MWRRALSSQLRTLASCRSTAAVARFASPKASCISPSPSASLFHRFLSESADGVLKKKVEDIMPIATGHEREELEAEIQGRDILEINNPAGPFGTKELVFHLNPRSDAFYLIAEAPAVVKSNFDKRIVGCPGGEGEDEHDVVWFWLEKGKPHECPVCSQYFVLEVVGPGGPPDGHGDDEDHHH